MGVAVGVSLCRRAGGPLGLAGECSRSSPEEESEGLSAAAPPVGQRASYTGSTSGAGPPSKARETRRQGVQPPGGSIQGDGDFST